MLIENTGQRRGPTATLGSRQHREVQLPALPMEGSARTPHPSRGVVGQQVGWVEQVYGVWLVQMLPVE